MEQQKIRPIFVVGAPRSGTTLFQYMLRSHPNISLPTGESHYIVPLIRDEKEFGDLGQKENIKKLLVAMYEMSADFLDTDLHGVKFDINRLADEFYLEGRETVESIFAGLMEKNAVGEGKVRWGDKTPYYVLHMKMLLQRFPGAQFIHLIRDGRDVALSLFGRKHDFGVYNTFYAAKYWEIYVELGREQGKELGPAVYHEVRYENLLDDPEKILHGVCEFLGEDFSKELIDFKKSGQAGKTPLVQKSVQKTNKDKWRKKMTSYQIKVFEGAVGNTLAKLGYPLVNDFHETPLPMKIFWRMHNKFLKYSFRFFKRGVST